MATSQERLLVEQGREACAAQFEVQPSWITQEIKTEEDLSDQEERVDDIEFDAESEHSVHDTDSEQSGGNSSDLEGAYKHDNPENYFVGKDNHTIWHANAPQQNLQTRRQNIVIPPPAVKSAAKHAKSPIDCWKLFFTDSMLEEILKHTNKHLSLLRPNYKRDRNCCETDMAEMHALLGLLYMAGLKKAQHLNVKELWATDGTGIECFRATMSRDRFLLLLRALRFDDFEDRESRKQLDNLAPIRNIVEFFNNKCRDNYQIGEYTTIDEMLEPFRGCCKFRVYIPSKPAKYGLKIYALVDSQTFYTSNIEIYAGHQPEGPYCMNYSATEIVKRLAEPILDTGRNITMDNFFTSIPLGKDLLQRRTTIVGALHKNKEEIPPSFIETKTRRLYSSLFGFIKEGVLVSYKTKSKSNVLAFSTFHVNSSIDESSGIFAMPEVIAFYNMTKGAVDVIGEMKSLYSVTRVSCRWPLTIFFGLMNTGGINAQVIYKANTNEIMDRRIFLKTLALDLMKGHLVARSTLFNLTLYDRTLIKRLAGIKDEEVPITTGNECRNGFCRFCPRRKNKKTKKICRKCEAPICPSHTDYTCIQCAELVPAGSNL